MLTIGGPIVPNLAERLAKLLAEEFFEELDFYDTEGKSSPAMFIHAAGYANYGELSHDLTDFMIQNEIEFDVELDQKSDLGGCTDYFRKVYGEVRSRPGINGRHEIDANEIREILDGKGGPVEKILAVQELIGEQIPPLKSIDKDLGVAIVEEAERVKER
jgi:hypothetical protein